MILATTTSTYDTGLLDAIIPPFEARSGIQVKVIAVGSGQALAMGERGEADLILSHAPEAEQQFMSRGFGISRRRLMYNDFILVGPAADPAAARQQRDILTVLAVIARSRAVFVSRGDDSGTHMLERKLWERAGLQPQPGQWYLETGQGMGATLRVASQKRAYTLTDRGTFLAQRRLLDLEVLYEGDPTLRNLYHVLIVNPRNGPRVNTEAARALARYLFSPEVLKTIDEFGRERFGQPLFFSDAGPPGQD